MRLMIVAPLNSTHSQRWIERLDATNSEVILVNSDSQQSEKNYPYRVIEMPDLGNYKNQFEYFWKLRKYYKQIVKEFSPQIVHVHWLYSMPAIIFSLIRGYKILLTPWGSDILHESRRDKNFIQKFKQVIAVQIVMFRADYACCDAKHLQKRMRRYIHKPNFASEIIYFGTDLKLFNPDRYSRSLRNKLAVSDGEIMVLSNRGLAQVYDIDTFIHAAKLIVEQRRKGVKFVIAGGGPEKVRLMHLVRELDLDNIIVFTGRLSDEEFADLTASCDIYVSTSTSDGGIAASVAEAMSCARPIIITNFGENGDWVELDNRTGYLFEIGDELRLADLIVKLAEDPVQRKTLGSNGRRVISEKNNSIIEARKADNMYKRLLGL